METTGFTGGGCHSYDSKTETITQLSFVHGVPNHTAKCKLSSKDKQEIYNLLLNLDVNSYPETYEPTATDTIPPTSIVLITNIDNVEKRIIANKVDPSYTPKDEKAKTFLNTCKSIENILLSYEEWKGFPSNEKFFD